MAETPAGLPDGPGPQRGIGLVAPFDFALDRELWRWLPDDLAWFTTRTPYLPVTVSLQMAEAVGDDQVVARAVQDLLVAEPLAVAYACTSGSFVDGIAGERRLRDAMERAGAPVAVTTSGALLDALAALGVSRVAVATPYTEQVTARLADFLAEAGVATTRTTCLGLVEGIAKVGYPTVARLVQQAVTDDAGAVFVSCTNLATYDLIEPLEQLLDRPVLSANQVTAWAALRSVGAKAVGPGQRLLSA